jgi:hypothetical protein
LVIRSLVCSDVGWDDENIAGRSLDSIHPLQPVSSRLSLWTRGTRRPDRTSFSPGARLSWSRHEGWLNELGWFLRRRRQSLSLRELEVLLGWQALPVKDVGAVSPAVASIEVIVLLPVLRGHGLGAVGEVILAEVVSCLWVVDNHELLNVAIKIFLVINFLSEKNNSVRFQSNFVSFNFLCILVITV